MIFLEWSRKLLRMFREKSQRSFRAFVVATSKDESVFGVHRHEVKKHIAELKTVVELMTLGAAILFASIVSGSSGLKYLGFFVSILGNTYLFLLFPFMPFAEHVRNHVWKNRVYLIAKSIIFFFATNLYLDWVFQLVDSALKG